MCIAACCVGRAQAQCTSQTGCAVDTVDTCLTGSTHIITTNTAMNFADAEAYCASRNGHLASVTSLQEHNDLTTLCFDHTGMDFAWRIRENSQKGCWLGLTDKGKCTPCTGNPCLPVADGFLYGSLGLNSGSGERPDCVPSTHDTIDGQPEGSCRFDIYHSAPHVDECLDGWTFDIMGDPAAEGNWEFIDGSSTAYANTLPRLTTDDHTTEGTWYPGGPTCCGAHTLDRPACDNQICTAAGLNPTPGTTCMEDTCLDGGADAGGGVSLSYTQTKDSLRALQGSDHSFLGT